VVSNRACNASATLGVRCHILSPLLLRNVLHYHLLHYHLCLTLSSLSYTIISLLHYHQCPRSSSPTISSQSYNIISVLHYHLLHYDLCLTISSQSYTIIISVLHYDLHLPPHHQQTRTRTCACTRCAFVTTLCSSDLCAWPCPVWTGVMGLWLSCVTFCARCIRLASRDLAASKRFAARSLTPGAVMPRTSQCAIKHAISEGGYTGEACVGRDTRCIGIRSRHLSTAKEPTRPRRRSCRDRRSGNPSRSHSADFLQTSVPLWALRQAAASRPAAASLSPRMDLPATATARTRVTRAHGCAGCGH